MTLAELTNPFESASKEALLTDRDRPKSSAWMISNLSERIT